MPAQLPAEEAEFFATHSTASDPGEQHRKALAGLPADPAELARITRDLLIHRVDGGHFGYEIPESRLHQDAETRYVSDILGLLRERDDAPLDTRRAPENRFVGTCRDFTMVHVTLLRNAGIPARARCGFATYFNPGFYDDHWVTEFWREGRGWVLTDPQLAFRSGESTYGTDVDPFDIPRDRFLTGGPAWQTCRTGAADPSAFGVKLPETDFAGRWFLAANVVRDLAALNKVEVLPWDSWGIANYQPDEEPSEDEAKTYDAIAELTTAGGPLAELRRIFGESEQVRTPETITSYTTYLGIRQVTLRSI
jgi:hypothetical protein